MGVAPLNTGYGYILCTPVILVQKHPKYHPQLSETLGKEMHTQFWPATRVPVLRAIKIALWGKYVKIKVC